LLYLKQVFRLGAVTIFRTRVFLVDGRHVQEGLLETLSFEGKLWLVRHWKPAKTAGFRQPVRLVRPTLAAFEKANPPKAGEDYFLAIEVPSEILDGLIGSESAEAFEVVEAPAVEIPIPTMH